MRAPSFWYRRGLFSTLLAPFGWIWAVGARLRAGRSPRHRSPIPVICVGNLSVGGVGKTPVAMSIARLIPGAHFLSKGYGGKENGPLRVEPQRHGYQMVGDEPLLLAEVAPCWIAKNRIEGAEAAASAGASVLVMDDGFQDPSLEKDISILVVDGATGFGNGQCLPAGPLREPVAQGLKRADAVVILGEDRHDVASLVAPKPVLYAWLEPEAEASVLTGRKVVAFAGIGRPAKFFHTLDTLGANLVEAYAFPDHYPFHPQEIHQLQTAANNHNAFLVTTGKDFVRVPANLRDQIGVVQMDIAWDDEEALLDVLAPTLGGLHRL
ncbi:MAG TPA: tetraacyldisaccharide 4'-kinase [Magnetospirillaceae bacterium]|nr:tetraacyldisaccharide 4'-kinase [Magnetospirillaceae bacterium]